MKVLASISFTALVFSMSPMSAAACDMHGAGGYHGAFGTKWSSYTSSGYKDEYTGEFTPVEKDVSSGRSVEVKLKKKPTFSNFSRLASVSAKSKLALKSSSPLAEQSNAAPAKLASRTPASKTDR